MYALLGSENKERVLFYLTQNPGKKAREISDNLNINYKLVFKILSEFLDRKILFKKNNQYFLKSEFIEYFKFLSESMLSTYTDSLFFKNRIERRDFI